MYFEKVQLPPFIIADLYKHSLVVLEDVQPKKIKSNQPDAKDVSTVESHIPIKKEESAHAPSATIDYLGGFQKKIMIVVCDDANPTIAQPDLQFLTGVLAACKLSLQDVAIVNIANQPNASLLWQQMPAHAMLLFDVDAATVGLPFIRPHFQIQSWNNAQFLTAPKLAQFQTGSPADLQLIKQQLWACLKKMFL